MSKLAVITPEDFNSRAWHRPRGYLFASSIHMVPVVAAELSRLVTELPLAFTELDGEARLVAVLSLQPRMNPFVAPDGRWLGGYVPAALRGYPFRLAQVQGRTDSVLCVDEESGLLADAGDGEPFFDADGKPAEAVGQILEFLAKTQRNAAVTQQAVDALKVADVLEPWPLTLKLEDARSVRVEGLLRVDEAALNALPDDDWLVLRRAGALPVAYAHLLSMGRIAAIQNAVGMQERLQSKQQSRAEDLGLKLNDDSLSFQW